jgi:hypothetical protein
MAFKAKYGMAGTSPAMTGENEGALLKLTL